jgi:iron complex transport system substrate-binding protein
MFEIIPAFFTIHNYLGGKIMRKRVLLSVLGIAILLAVSVFLCGCGEKTGSEKDTGEQKIKVTDLSGREVEIAATAKKVVAIGPGALRLVCYVNGADKVVGIEEMEKNSPTGRPYYMANADLLSDLPTIGQGGPETQPDAEKLVSIKPDVIFSCFTDKSQSDELQNKTGIPVVVLDYGTLSTFSQEIYDSLGLIGKITGEEGSAQEVIDYLDECQRDLNDRTKDIPDNEKPSVYVGGLGMKGTHGIESTYGEYPPFTSVNAKNVVDEAGKSGSVTIDREKLISWNPDILFVDSGGYQLVMDDYKKNPSFYKSLSANKRIKAANVPIVPEVEPPSELFRISSRKIIGLTVQPQSLLQIRQERLKSLGLTTDAEYASLSRIQKELAYADRLMAQLGCSVIDVTNKAVEETASRVLEDYYKGERDAR